MKYKKIVVSAFGNPDVLKVVEEELRPPPPGDVLVRVHAAGVARADCARRSSDWSGQVPPFSLGYDFSGTIEALGEGVSSFDIGQRVAGINERLDSYAEYVLVKPEWIVAIPDSVDIAQAACLGLNYLVAYQCLYRIARVRSGDGMLVLGASGGVGTALVELGILANLDVYGTAATAKTDLISELGATPIDYQREAVQEFTKELSLNSVFDGIFDIYFEAAYNSLVAGGKYVVFGFLSPPQNYERQVEKIENLNLASTDNRDIINYGVLEPYGEDLTQIASFLAAGKINPIVHERIPLQEASRAHQLLESGEVAGKIVLICD
jgi:NADPH:quinone reductase-like Zn-dependent oxidoreductase